MVCWEYRASKLTNKPMRKASPAKAMGGIKVNCKAFAYASKTPGRDSGGTTSRRCVAPAFRTTKGLTLGASFGNSFANSLEKIFCAIDIDMAPPSELKNNTMDADVQVRKIALLWMGTKLTSDGRKIRGQSNLDSEEWYLYSCTTTDTRENLVTKPLASGGVDIQSVNHSTSYGKYSSTDPKEGSVMTSGGDNATNDDRRNSDRHQVRDSTNTRAYGCSSFDGLEIEWEVVDCTARRSALRRERL